MQRYDEHSLRYAAAPPHVRHEHEVFLGQASDLIAHSLIESSQLVNDIDPRRQVQCPRQIDFSQRPASQPPLASQTSCVPGASRAKTASGRAASMASHDRHSRSARDLFEALSSSAGETVSQPPLASSTEGSRSPRRCCTVRDYLRGQPVVMPDLSFNESDLNWTPPGHRKRLAEQSAMTSTMGAHGVLSALNSSMPLHGGAGAFDVPALGAGLVARQRATPALADGVTSMLSGAYLDLGELITAPTAVCSGFDYLLDRLVDAPESCFVNPSSSSRRGRGGANAELLRDHLRAQLNASNRLAGSPRHISPNSTIGGERVSCVQRSPVRVDDGQGPYTFRA